MQDHVPMTQQVAVRCSMTQDCISTTSSRVLQHNTGLCTDNKQQHDTGPCTDDTTSSSMPQHDAGLHTNNMTSSSTPQLRSDMGFLAFSFPRSLGSGIYDKINGGQQKLMHTYLSYISTKFRPI